LLRDPKNKLEVKLLRPNEGAGQVKSIAVFAGCVIALNSKLMRE